MADPYNMNRPRVPTVPEPNFNTEGVSMVGDPVAPSKPPGLASRVGSFFSQSGREVASAARAAVRDPGGAVVDVANALPGVAGIGQAPNLFRGLRAASQAGGVGQFTRAGAASTAARAAGSAAVAAPVAALAAQNDALSQPNGGLPATSYTPSNVRRCSGTVPHTTTDAPAGTEGTYQFGDGQNRILRLKPGEADASAAAEAGRGPDRVAAMNNNADNISLRGRQGAIIANPNSMSTLDRIRSLGSDPSLRGSPSLRKLAAEQIMGEAQNVEDNFQGAQQKNAGADLAQTQMRANATEQFARRRQDADQFNVNTSENRREQDTDAALNARELGLKAQAQRAAQQLADATAVSQRYDGMIKDLQDRNPGMSYEDAAARVSDIATDEGTSTGAAPALRGAATREAAGLEAASAAKPDGWFGGLRKRSLNAIKGLDWDESNVTEGNFDPSNFSASEQGFWQRRADNLYNALDNVLPGDQTRADDQVILTDKSSGRRIAAPRSAIGGRAASEFERARLERMQANGQR